MNEYKTKQMDSVETALCEQEAEQRNALIAGFMLIGIGAIVLVGQFINLSWAGLLIPALLGGLFMLWGVFTRNSGLMIPGGILGGIGLGVVLLANPVINFAGANGGGIFMLAFAAGWASITVMSALFGEETHWWALIPGSIMGLVGAALIFGGLLWSALSFLGQIWPIFLILAGLSLIFRRGGGRDQLVEK